MERDELQSGDACFVRSDDFSLLNKITSIAPTLLSPRGAGTGLTQRVNRADVCTADSRTKAPLARSAEPQQSGTWAAG